MARKQEIVVVPKWEGSRDAGKQFLLTEMPAAQAEKWAVRAFLALKNSGERIPDNYAGLGMVGVMVIGINVFLQGNIRMDDLEPLMDEMMTCVQAVRDPKHPNVATALIDNDIEEVRTRAWIRAEVLRLHTGFSVADALLNLVSAISSASTSSTM